MHRKASSTLSPTRRLVRRAATIAVATIALAACTPVVNVRGYVPNDEALARIEPQKTRRTDVESALGSPSTESPLNRKVWYYMNETTEQVAFFEPKVLERKIIAIVFDERDIVADVVTYTDADGQEVEIVSRTTPTAGNEVTILQQLFGNIGRFSK